MKKFYKSAIIETILKYEQNKTSNNEYYLC